MYEQKLWQDHVTEFEDRYGSCCWNCEAVCFHSVTCRDRGTACLPSGVPLWLFSGFYPSCWCICIAKRIQRRVCVDRRRLL